MQLILDFRSLYTNKFIAVYNSKYSKTVGFYDKSDLNLHTTETHQRKMIKIKPILVIFISNIILCHVSSSVASVLLSNSKNNSAVSHFVDENGVKVEKQIAEAVVVQTGYETSTESLSSELGYDNDDSYEEDGDDDEEGNAAQQDSSPSENTSDNDTQKHSNLRPANVIDIFTALHSAWREVEKFRQKNAEMKMLENRTLEDDRLRRDSMTDTIQPLTPAPDTSVSQARYIKGDPLKGYYDFVITEGSYKFWAAFQLATAALVIYSTFAAIYYSKVNPITSDYDYVDYLGGGRALSDVNVDYQDPTDDTVKSPSSSGKHTQETQNQGTFSWLSLLKGGWTSNVGKNVRTVLDYVDKLTT